MKFTLLTLITSLLVSGCSMLGQRYGEEALYATLFSDGDYEIRLYEPLIVAQTPSSGSYLQATREGYKRLTDYVSGENLAGQLITGASAAEATNKSSSNELTTPYFEELIDGFWLTSATMPEKYSLATIPKPSNDLITFATLPRIKTAVIRFSGIKSERLITQKANELLAWIKQEGLIATSAARSAVFESALSLPGLRRHEVHISIQ